MGATYSTETTHKDHRGKPIGETVHYVELSPVYCDVWPLLHTFCFIGTDGDTTYCAGALKRYNAALLVGV